MPAITTDDGVTLQAEDTGTGEPLRRSKLIGEGQSFMSSILPSGMRAVATAISADTSAGGFRPMKSVGSSSVTVGWIHIVCWMRV